MTNHEIKRTIRWKKNNCTTLADHTRIAELETLLENDKKLCKQYQNNGICKSDGFECNGVCTEYERWNK